MIYQNVLSILKCQDQLASLNRLRDDCGHLERGALEQILDKMNAISYELDTLKAALKL